MLILKTWNKTYNYISHGRDRNTEMQIILLIFRVCDYHINFHIILRDKMDSIVVRG